MQRSNSGENLGNFILKLYLWPSLKMAYQLPLIFEGRVSANIQIFTLKTTLFFKKKYNWCLIHPTYSYCDFSHLFKQLAELTSFTNFKPYGQLLSKASGVLGIDGWTLIPEMINGFSQTSPKGFKAAGKDLGKIISQLLDSTFWRPLIRLSLRDWESTSSIPLTNFLSQYLHDKILSKK